MRSPFQKTFRGFGSPFGNDGVSVAPAVSDKSFDYGLLSADQAGGYTVEPEIGAITISSITIDSASLGTASDFETSGATIRTSVGNTFTSNTTLNCTATMSDSSTFSFVSTITAESNVYSFRTRTEFAAIIALGVATISGSTAKARAGSYTWVNADLDARAFTSRFTVASHDTDDKMQWTTTDIGTSGDVQLSSSNNLSFEDIAFVANYDRTLHTATTAGLKIKGPTNQLAFKRCTFTGNLTTIGPGRSFRGWLGSDGTSQVNGDFLIEDCTISGSGRGLNIGTGTGASTSTGRIIIRNTEFVDCGTDGIVLSGAVDNNLIEDNYLHDFYNDTYRVSSDGTAYLTRATLTGAADSKKFMFQSRHHWSDAGSISTLYEQSSDLKIWRDAAGLIYCDIKDTGGSAVVSLVSTNVIDGAVSDILISVDTDGSGYLYIKQQVADGSGSWVQEDSETYAGQTLKLSTGTIAIGATRTGTEFVGGDFERVTVWHGVSEDITSSAIRDTFATGFNTRIEPSVIAGIYGTPIVSVFGFNTVWDAGTNSGSGGDFAKPSGGNFDNTHGDIFQAIPGAIRDVDGWVLRRNMMIAGREDDSPFAYEQFQGIFMEDIADVTNQYNYNNIEIYDNVVSIYNSTHGISLYNAVDAEIYNNHIVYDPAIKLTGGLAPSIHLLNQFGGTGSGSIVEDNILPTAVDIEAGFGSSSNNIIADDTTTGANAWTNLFDGTEFSSSTKAEVLTKFNAKAGGPLLTSSPKIGAIGQGFTDWVAQTSTARNGADIVAPVLTLPTDTANGSSASTGTSTTDTGNGELFYVITTGSTPPNSSQVIGGLDNAGLAASDSGRQFVSSSGLQNIAGSGLDSSTAYTTFYVHIDDKYNISAVSTASGFTTGSPVTIEDDDFSTNTDTYPNWTTTTLTKTYPGTNDRMNIVMDTGVSFKGTGLQMTVVDATVYNYSLTIKSKTASNQIDVVFGTTESSTNIATSARVSGGATTTLTGSFTSSGTTLWAYPRLRGTADASNDEFEVEHISIISD